MMGAYRYGKCTSVPSGIKAAIQVEVRASQGSFDLLGHLFQGVQSLSGRRTGPIICTGAMGRGERKGYAMLIVDAQIHIWRNNKPTNPNHRQITDYTADDVLREM